MQSNGWAGNCRQTGEASHVRRGRSQRKLGAAKERVADKFPVAEATSEEQRNAMKRAKAEFPNIRRKFHFKRDCSDQRTVQRNRPRQSPQEIDPRSGGLGCDFSYKKASAAIICAFW